MWGRKCSGFAYIEANVQAVTPRARSVRERWRRGRRDRSVSLLTTACESTITSKKFLSVTGKKKKATGTHYYIPHGKKIATSFNNARKI